MRRDYPLAALDVISQRCRELMSAKDHHGPTTRAADTMTAPEQLGAARMEATESRDEDDHSHVVQVNKTVLLNYLSKHRMMHILHVFFIADFLSVKYIALWTATSAQNHN